MTDAVGKPEPDSAVCLFCKGNGLCAKCEGRGVRESVRARRKTMVVCNACDGSAVCPLCHGTGAVAPSRTTA